jgi:hypothetical protein
MVMDWLAPHLLMGAGWVELSSEGPNLIKFKRPVNKYIFDIINNKSKYTDLLVYKKKLKKEKKSDSTLLRE